MSTKEKSDQKIAECSTLDQTLNAYWQQESESCDPEHVSKELKQQLQFPDGVWEKLAKR
jgi:hypothetical protein